MKVRNRQPPTNSLIAEQASLDLLFIGVCGERGWEALAERALEISRGACAVITADGSGPALVAKVGAVALASATGAALVPVGADCRPAIYERHKWDQVCIGVRYVACRIHRQFYSLIFL